MSDYAEAVEAGQRVGQEKAAEASCGVPLTPTTRFSRVRMKTPTVRGVLDLDDPKEPTEEETPR